MMKLPHLIVVAATALLLGAGIGLLGYASTYDEGSHRWESLMQVSGGLLTAAVALGIGWILWLSITRRRS